MKRLPIPSATEAQVLLASRRRCAICFGLYRDASLKRGQIAHLDRDRTNHASPNLAFLCFDHHDQFDSSTSQSKNLTVAEVRTFRDELLRAIEQAWKAPASFDAKLVSPEIPGRYIWSDELATAELQVSMVSPPRARVEGFATWGLPERGAHTGELSFEADLTAGTLVYADWQAQYSLLLRFSPGLLIASESGGPGYLGLNVTFGGMYSRVAF